MIITATIAYVLSTTIPCHVPDEFLKTMVVEGCYEPYEDKIYVLENTSRPIDFIVYHEIGHSLFNTRVPFNYSVFKDCEWMAEYFALWIYNKKYPSMDLMVDKEKSKFFESYCNKKCVKDILKIDVKGMTYPFKPFWLNLT